MDVLGSNHPGLAHRATRGGMWRDLAALVLLLLLAGSIRAWVVWRTAVPARDSIGFITYAKDLESLGWSTTLLREHQHPGYPLSVLAVSVPVRHFLGESIASQQLSAQLASSLAGLLLVVPMFYLGRHLYDSAIGFWGALLFQCLPVSGPLLSDGVTDPLFLLFAAAGLLFVMQAVRSNSPVRFGLAGLFCGLAYLTRPEGVVLLPATALALLGFQLVPGWRRPWKRVLKCGAAMTLAALVVGSPYYLTVMGFTNKPSLQYMTGTDEASVPAAPPHGPLFAATFTAAPTLEKQVGRAGWALASALGQSYQGFGWLPLLAGLWWFRGHYRRMPEVWVLVSVFVVHGSLLWWLATSVNYVSERHVLLLVVCSIFQATAAVREIPVRLLGWLSRRGTHRLWLGAPGWSLLLLLVLTGAGLTKTLQPLHGNRAGHSAAGRWLAEHTCARDVVDDDHRWAVFYAGRVLGHGSDTATGHPAEHYVVVSRANERRPPSHPVVVNEASLRREGGRVVYHYPEGGPVETANVLIYHMPSP